MSKVNLLDSQEALCIIWAAGFTREYPYLSEKLRQKLWDPERYILRNKRGITDAPGLYVLGYRWMVRKDSNFIDGVGQDAASLAQDILQKSCPLLQE